MASALLSGFFFSSRRRHTSWNGDWSSDVCSSDLFTRQTLFFTATMPPEIQRITEQFLHNPVRVEVSRPASTVSTTAQSLVKTGREPHDKRETLRRLIRASVGMK